MPKMTARTNRLELRVHELNQAASSPRWVQWCFRAINRFITANFFVEIE